VVALVQLDALDRRAVLDEHVLVDAGRLTRDVLEDDDVHCG
jgi:hypothetical protein